MSDLLNLEWKPKDPAARKKDTSSPQLEIIPDSPASAPMEHRVSPHNMMVSPDTPADHLEKAQIPHLNSTGGLTPLIQLQRKAELQASTPDEA